MSLLGLLFRRRKQDVVFDSRPGEVREMPLRPYRVLQADVPLYSDHDCRKEVTGARLLILQCEDSRQKHKIVECMPTRKIYSRGQIVCWDLDKDRIWPLAWYLNPETGNKEKAWTRAVEFVGKTVKI